MKHMASTIVRIVHFIWERGVNHRQLMFLLQNLVLNTLILICSATLISDD
jgi:hypothetical protein